MACSRTREFFANGTAAQFDFILGQYDTLLKLKVEQKGKSSKADSVIKLDHWYQHELPKKIKSRAKDMHMTHDELVQTIKWKLARGKFRPNLTNLIQMNTPRLVMQETKKAFRKIVKEDLPSAVNALCNLKGVGPAMASAVLAAAAPDVAPFMADECLYALPDVDSLDYTMKEYMRFVEHVNQCVERINDGSGTWTPHKVELAVWAHYVAVELKPELLEEMPGADASNGKSVKTNGSANKAEATVTSHAANGMSAATSEEDSNLSAEDSNLSAASLPENGAPPKSLETSSVDTDETSQDTNGDAKSANGDSSAVKHSPSREESNGESFVPETSSIPEESSISEETSVPVPETQEEASPPAQTLKRPSPDRDEDEDTAKSEDAAGNSEPAQKKLKSAEEPAAVAV